ncbi:MAG TPA: MauE/DoxX family redox-associated membrane protein [Ilumatobacteraceae bacterium]|nr:MauE/DoxX family redox-associated membrane protein [Ilumatobacteraceae bacterium]
MTPAENVAVVFGDSVGIVAAIVLGAAFVLAGATKLAAGRTWPAQAAELGAPAWSIRPLPWVELVLGAVLVSNLDRRPASIVALVLLLVFSTLVIARLREGRHPPCACFGAWSARPLGPGHLVRNGVLVVLAVVAAAA